MTPEEQRLIMSLVVVPGRGRQGDPRDVLDHFETHDGRALGRDLLREAVDRRDAVDVEMALIVCAVFGYTMDHFDSLVRLCSADWHYKHEDVVTGLGELRTSHAVDALYLATQWVPEYLDYDEGRALARKAIWAIGGTPGTEAGQALARLLSSSDEILQEAAREQLGRRDGRHLS
ncbi:hypothetical protein [Microbispora sp. NPDC049125]|uniref:hypothetical protein n=1 Tax=Microbispora sp. NPDC049125 TaxID=3154929 RepID=UPI003467264B